MRTLLRPPFLGAGVPKIDLAGCELYVPLHRPDMVASGGSIVNGTGICTGSPLNLSVGANTVDVTQAGTFTVAMPEGGTVASGTMTVTASPVTIPAGTPTVITTTGATGNITVTSSNIIRSRDKNRYPCTVTGATWGSQGRSFVAANAADLIDCGTAINPRAEMTLIAWIKPTDVTATNTNVIVKRDAVGTRQYHLGIAGTQKLQFVSSTTTDALTTTNSTGTLTQGQWAHIGAIFSSAAGSQILYRDGAADGSSNFTVGGLLSNVTPTLRLGRNLELNSWYGGVIGEVFIYSRVLTASELMNNYLVTKWRYK